MFMILAFWNFILWAVDGKSAVLDPSIYLFPSPPMTPTQDNMPTPWSLPRIERKADLSVLPVELVKPTTLSAAPTKLTLPTTSPITPTTQQEEIMEKAETFWPNLRSNPYFGINVPLTYGLTGTYGRYGSANVPLGIIGTRYASVSDAELSSYGLYGNSGLAGSSYGSYSGGGRTNIYGSGGTAAWSGWGNGKWGHYGKG